MRAIGGEARDLAGKIRRMAISLTSRSFWQVVGHRLLDNSTETRDVEIFSGIGFYARPPADGKPEAMVAFQEGGANPVIIAIRDEKTRRAVAGAIGVDETAMYNTVAMVLVKSNETIEIRTPDGIADPVARKSDIAALRTALGTAVIALGAGGAADIAVKADLVTGGPNTWPVGTTVLKAE